VCTARVVLAIVIGISAACAGEVKGLSTGLESAGLVTRPISVRLDRPSRLVAEALAARSYGDSEASSTRKRGRFEPADPIWKPQRSWPGPPRPIKADASTW